jgi:glycosyltransferase involved in cell wall biosynthesis
MHVLIANHRLDQPAGTETYALTLAERLLAEGHRVTCFSLRLGEVAALLREKGAATVDDARDADSPDVVHASHLDAGHLAMAAWPTTPTVFVVHGNGTRAVVERPPLWQDPVQVWVAVSEHVADVMAARDGIARDQIEVVPNFVDLHRFTPLQGARAPVRTVMLHSNHHDDPLRLSLAEACGKVGATLRIVGAGRRQQDIVSEINYADAVVAIGRSALEAMACGRPVLQYSAYGGDGPCRPETAERALAWNYSGLATRAEPDAGRLADELSGFGPESGRWSREWVERHHDPEQLVPCLVDLYRLAAQRMDEQLRSAGSEALIRSRFAGFYPSLRWWHRAPDLVDWSRASHSFPVWAPDVDEELPVLLTGLAEQLEGARGAGRTAAAEATEARAEAEAARTREEAARVDAEAARRKAEEARADADAARADAARCHHELERAQVAADELAGNLERERSQLASVTSTRTWKAHDRLTRFAAVRAVMRAVGGHR